MKISIFLFFIGLLGCASIPQADLSQLAVGMTTSKVKSLVGTPLLKNKMYIKRDGKAHNTDVAVWEYRNFLQGEGTLLFFQNEELKQIERGYVRGAYWPAPDFKYNLVD